MIGCSATPPPQDQFYRLEPEPVTVPAKQISTGTILVTQLNARGFSGGARIVFRDNVDRLRVQRYRNRLWSDPPAAMIQDAIVQALRAEHIAEYVITPAERANANWIVSGTLFRIEHLRDVNQVNIEFELGLINAQNRKTVFQHGYSQAESAEDTSMASVVAAFNLVLAQLIATAVKDIGVVVAECTQQASACR